jgi:hypothetical protein
MPDAKTVHLRLPPAYLERGTLLNVLRQMLKRASTGVGVTVEESGETPAIA